MRLTDIQTPTLTLDHQVLVANVRSRVSVLPNHACMTAAMFKNYYVVGTGGGLVKDIWSRTNGWNLVAPDKNGFER